MQRSYLVKSPVHFADFGFFVKIGDMLVHDTSNSNRLTVYRNGEMVKAVKQTALGLAAMQKSGFIEEVQQASKPAPKAPSKPVEAPKPAPKREEPKPTPKPAPKPQQKKQEPKQEPTPKPSESESPKPEPKPEPKPTPAVFEEIEDEN